MRSKTRFLPPPRESLMGQLETSLTKADSEQLARSIAEEQYSDLEKEKIMKELEIKDMMARHKQELGDKEATISSVRAPLTRAPLPPPVSSLALPDQRVHVALTLPPHWLRGVG